MKEIKEKNNQIDTLLLSFSEHNIDENIESQWLLNSSQLHSRLRYYYPLLEVNELKLLLSQKPEDLFTNLFSQILNPIYFLWKGQSVYGGYAPLEQNNLEVEIANQKKNKNSEESQFIVSTIEK